jgi:YidC/Oxa1 family membrane protein insertase
MSDQVRGILFVIASLLILFAWGHFYKPPVPPPQTNPAQSSAPFNPPGSQQGSAQPGATGNASSSATAAKSGAGNAAAAANSSVAEASEEKTVVVQSALYRVELSNRGGVAKTWQLNKYMDDQKPPRPLDLVNDSVAQELGWPFSLVLTDPQLEAKANSALYQVQALGAQIAAARAAASDAGQGPFQAPIKIIFHWSDGHLDVTKTLNFSENYQTTAEVRVTLDGKPQPVAVAWRGGFGDKAVYNAAQLVTVYYKTGGKLSLLQYKKLGVSGNQSQPAVQYGPLEFAGVEDQFFTAAFLPDGTDISLWHWMQNHNVTADGKQTSEPEAQMAAGTTTERFIAAGKNSAAAGRAGKFWMDRSHRQTAAVDFADAAHQGVELGLVHRTDDAGDQPGDVSAEDEELAFDAENAEGGPRDTSDSGSLQEIFDERSAQEKNERRSDGGVQPRRN